MTFKFLRPTKVALVSCLAAGIVGGCAMPETSNTINRINPSNLPNAAAVGYSQISVSAPGTLAFISGQVAWGTDGAEAPDDLAEQSKIVVENARKALEAINASPQDILMVKVYVVDLTPVRQEIVWEHLLDFFEGTQPSLTGLGVAALGGPDLQLELELVVRVPS